MTSEEQVRAVLEARYFDLRNILAEKLKREVDDEVVDCVVNWTVCKCLRIAAKYDPAKGTAWRWVLMVGWGQLQRLYRSSSDHEKRDGRKGVKPVKQDALEHSVDEGQAVPEVPQWGVRAEEDYIIAVIDLKREGGKRDIR